MKRSVWSIISVMLVVALVLVPTAAASPPYPEEPELWTGRPPQQPLDQEAGKPIAARTTRPPKHFDQPNVKDFLRNRQRQLLLEENAIAAADTLDLTGTDRVLVILVEFAGTDVFTWTAPISPSDPTTGSQWDPYGRADPNEYTGVVGDCSLIITETTRFTYTGPVHNEIPRPLSPDDRSGDSIWTEDFNPDWYRGFMFSDGVVISYTMVDGTPVYVDFTGQSVTDYYRDMSAGIYTITGDIIGWLPLNHSTWWYGADMCPGARSGVSTPWHGQIPGAGSARTLVKDALDAVNAISNTIPGFDWRNYDLDGDGIIDRLWIVHSGYGEEDSTTLLNRTDYGESSIWSHSSSVSPPYSVTQDVAAGPYIMMPENGGIGVFAHEYGHNLGADDLYAYGEGDTSAGFWTLMADDWTGYPIGFEPPAVDPWHLENWGWLDPFVIDDPSQVYVVTLGQASRFPGGEGVYRGAKIVLPDGVHRLPVPVWQGNYYWWGGKENLANARMTTKVPIDLSTATAATLTFDLVYDIEDQWDFLWVQVSEDGTTWNYTDTLTNANTQCDHDPGWIGGLYGFPDDLCGAGIGGFYGYNANWPDPETQVFDLTPYAGKSIYLRLWYMTDWAALYTGAFVDNVQVDTEAGTVFADNAESGDANWNYEFPWIRSDGTQSFSHNLYLQWRNVGENGGYDSALGESRWRYGPANSGLLVWYNNNFYHDNEIFEYLFDDPGFGPKGRMLVIDSHPEPYRDPYWVDAGYDNEGGNVPHRSLMRDAPFSLLDTVDFTMTAPYVVSTTQFSGRPAASEFHDALGYYPGAEFKVRSPYQSARWMTKQWDASAVVPSQEFYGINAPGYTANEQFRWACSIYTSGPYEGMLGCYWLGADVGLGYDGTNGEPREANGQYGWHVKILSQTDITATVMVWNSPVHKVVGPAPEDIGVPGVYTFTYWVGLHNAGVNLITGTITMTMPSGVKIVGTSPAGATIVDDTVVWSDVSLEPSQWVTYTTEATVTVTFGDRGKSWTASLDVFDGSTWPPEHDEWTTQAWWFNIYLPLVTKGFQP